MNEEKSKNQIIINTILSFFGTLLFSLIMGWLPLLYSAGYIMDWLGRSTSLDSWDIGYIAISIPAILFLTISYLIFRKLSRLGWLLAIIIASFFLYILFNFNM